MSEHVCLKDAEIAELKRRLDLSEQRQFDDHDTLVEIKSNTTKIVSDQDFMLKMISELKDDMKAERKEIDDERKRTAEQYKHWVNWFIMLVIGSFVTTGITIYMANRVGG